jgi:hypothetical protein
MTISRQFLCGIILVLAAGTSGAGDIPSLYRIDRADSVDRNRLLEAGVPLIAELESAFLAAGTTDEVAAAATLMGLEIVLLDEDTSNAAYALVGLQAGGTLPDVTRCGEVVWNDGGWLLLKNPRRDVEPCTDGRAFSMTPLPLETIGRTRGVPEHLAPLAEGRTDSLVVDPLVLEMVTQVDVDFAMSHWEAVVGWAVTRYSNTAGCQTASEQVHMLFDAWGLNPEYQYHTSGHAPTVIGTIPGRIDPDQVYIVIGHLDDMPSSGPAPGADDNASGTAMVLALAEIMSAYDFAYTIKFIAVTGEEWGLYGSEFYAARAAAQGEDIQAVLNGDMIGWEGNGTPDPEDMDINYNTSSAWLGTLMVDAAEDYPVGIPINAFQCNDMAYSDHWPFWQEGWSAICAITDNHGFCGEGGTYPYYHTSQDTIANCGAGAPEFEAAAIRLFMAAAGHLAEPLCERSDPPGGVTAVAGGTNRIDLSWASAGPGLSYEIRRAPGGCSNPGPESMVGETMNLSFIDTTASGGVPYGYTVHAKDSSGYCISSASVCVDASTTGPCFEAPNFAGVTGVVDSTGQTCLLTVDWDPPMEVYCGGDVAYNVYRSTTPGFEPSAANRIATLTPATTFDDFDVVFDETYHYLVRAVDQSNGAEDGNAVEMSGSPTGPPTIGTWFDDAGDTDPAVLTLELPWHAADSGGSAGPKVYQTGAYSSDTCAAAATPELLLGPSPTLEFWSRYDIEGNWDKGIVEISANGGSSWTRLEVGYPGYAGNTGDQCGLPTGTYFTGTDMTYDAYTASLAPWSGQEVIIRWRLSSDGYVEETGWWIDDISITDVSVPGECSSESPFVFDDGFESGDTTEWSTVGP